jgi:hypothetical protein
VVHCEGKCPSCTSEGNDILSKTNDTTFKFIAKEEEDRDFCVYIMWEKRDVLRVNISLDILQQIKYLFYEVVLIFSFKIFLFIIVIYTFV